MSIEPLTADQTQQHTPGPWDWSIEDASMATLMGPRELRDHVMSVSPCRSCSTGEASWEWGRCTTPTLANARLIAAAPDLLEALAELSAMYAHTWDRVDGALVMLHSGVTRFEAAHAKAAAALEKARG
jgi:hypothetical protein